MILLLFSVVLNYPPVSSSQVSHKEPEILIFRLQQSFKVGLLQPSSVTVYEYYNPGRGTNPDHHSSHHITAELRRIHSDLTWNFLLHFKFRYKNEISIDINFIQQWNCGMAFSPTILPLSWSISNTDYITMIHKRNSSLPKHLKHQWEANLRWKGRFGPYHTHWWCRICPVNLL